MQLKETPKNREVSQGGVARYGETICKSVLFIVQELREVGRESMLIDFILHPSKYMNMLPEIYQANPDLKTSIKLRQKREK